MGAIMVKSAKKEDSTKELLEECEKWAKKKKLTEVVG